MVSIEIPREQQEKEVRKWICQSVSVSVSVRVRLRARENERTKERAGGVECCRLGGKACGAQTQIEQVLSEKRGVQEGARRRIFWAGKAKDGSPSVPLNRVPPR